MQNPDGQTRRKVPLSAISHVVRCRARPWHPLPYSSIAPAVAQGGLPVVSYMHSRTLFLDEVCLTRYVVGDLMAVLHPEACLIC